MSLSLMRLRGPMNIHVHLHLHVTQLVLGSAAATAAMLPFGMVIPKLFEAINTYDSLADQVRRGVHSRYKGVKAALVRRRRELVRLLSPKFRGRREEVDVAAFEGCVPPAWGTT